MSALGTNRKQPDKTFICAQCRNENHHACASNRCSCKHYIITASQQGTVRDGKP